MGEVREWVTLMDAVLNNLHQFLGANGLDDPSKV